MNKEVIETAAVLFRGKIFSVPRPGRHDVALEEAAKQSGLHCIIKEKQGFVTSTGRFVDRIEAAQIALAAGQIKKLKWPPNLYSEDLWEGPSRPGYVPPEKEK